MRLVSRRCRRHLALPVGITAVAAIVLSISVGSALAQPQPTMAAKKPSPDSLAKKKAGAANKPAAIGKPEAKGRPKAPPIQMNKDSKWACDKTTVSLEPVWRGPKGVTFEFDIRNEGTAPLQIKAKGG